jgi:PAS domain S-box-containing protein
MMPNTSCRLLGAVVLLAMLLFAWPLAAVERGPQGTVRVGIFPFEPFNFIDHNGIAQGLNPDLLREMVRDQDWRIEFVPCTWAEGLERLQNENIDLMVSVAYTAQRAEIMDFPFEPVAELWGQVFVRPEGSPPNINELHGRTVAIMRKDISGANFIKTAEQFGVRCQIQEYATHHDVFAAVRNGSAYAGVAPQHFGLRHAREHDLIGSNILFSPFSIYFASKKGRQHELLSLIDAHLSRWKKDKDSFYYQSLNQWMGNPVRSTRFPRWLLSVLLATGLVALTLGGISLYLKRVIRQRTKELRESEANYRFVISAMEESLAVVDGNGRVLFANDKAAQALAGSSPEAIIGADIRDLVAPEQGEQLVALYRRTIELGQPQVEEMRATLDSGEHWFLNRLLPIEYGPAHTKAVLAIALDITERKRTEEALLHSEERFTLAMQATTDGLFDWNLATNAVYYSPGWKQMLGYRDEELANDLSVWQQLIDPQEATHAWAVVKELLAGRRDRIELEFRMRHKDGHWVDVLARANAVLDAAGRPIRVVGTHVDISERKRAEEERKQVQLQLVQAQKMEAIGTLAGGIAHDFNNMLSAIIGYAEMAKEDSPQGSTLARDMEAILQAGGRARDLVKQILTFSRQEITQPVLHDPAVIVQEAASMLRPSLPTTIAIQVTIAPDVPAVLADPVHLHQIVINLATNAYHAMEDRGGELRLHLDAVECTAADLQHHADIRPGRFVRLSVSDTGTGISPAVQNRMFEPFFTTKETGKGTGMGLATVHGIVTNCGGFITCESQLGFGTTFHVFLPAQEGALASKQQGEIALPTGKGHILLVDDEQLLVDLGRDMLERLGYEVTSHTSSAEALTAFARAPERFDLVITDQTMPGLTGIELARQLLAIRPELPIILCTGYSTRINEAQALACGIRAFAMKPLTTRDIATLLQEVLAPRHPAQESEPA